MTETPTWIRRAASGLREPEAQRRMPLGDLPPTPNTMFEMMRSMQAKIGLLEQRNQVLAACAGVASDGPAVSNATKIQKSWRRFCAVRVLRHACTSAALIQSVFRGLHQRKVFRAHKEAAATSRRRSCWRSLAAARLAITRLQARERARSTSRDFQRQRQSAAVIQSRLRCYATEVLHNEHVSKTSLILTSVKQREEICHLRRLLSVATQANAKYSNEVKDDSDEDYDYDFDQKLEEARAEEVLEYESDEECFGAQLRALVEDGFELDQSGFTIEQMKDAMHAIGISTAGIIGPGGTPDRQELITLVKRTIAARSTEEVGDAVMGDFEADEA
ncbi:hypothetical protein EMIHUDRAFT_227204 [Emiliania huxleyi CCMP1516]|uniref:Myosin motor domain-containing protein n=2 Tax=Emiliania huxleyi TaxID=2903 RepID=A0A0D3KJE4_EMIH1|nr:hypothetical protein EMIHUDRAFT_227204 [Emiliania huxleyi CCMP1516]EOD35879.1 hypothetical protein EMIHUDRAFT_227204 [Emiliania huxleyi CCMP1516]|eukprot:XP_005788308.1 hypothetical protein EMIHUDRAFT_227204 [Emiliania huxleyi CCMP1516]